MMPLLENVSTVCALGTREIENGSWGNTPALCDLGTRDIEDG